MRIEQHREVERFIGLIGCSCARNRGPRDAESSRQLHIGELHHGSLASAAPVLQGAARYN